MVTEQQLLKADEQELGFTLAMQGRSIEELQRKMEQAEVRASHKGVITWVKTETGSSVNAGEVIARLADLSSYKIKATISDTYADQLKVGGNATVRINDTDLKGTISSVEPTVSNGIITFYVCLQEKAHPLLRPSLRLNYRTTFIAKTPLHFMKWSGVFISADRKGRKIADLTLLKVIEFFQML
jgi:HlyD family secretion protein